MAFIITPRGYMWFSRMRVQGHAGSEPLPPRGSEFLRQSPLQLFGRLDRSYEGKFVITKDFVKPFSYRCNYRNYRNYTKVLSS